MIATGQTPALAERIVDTPLGPMRLTAGPTGLRTADWSDGDRAGAPSAADRPAGAVAASAAEASAEAILDRAAAQLAEYFGGRRTRFDVPLDPVGTPFQRRSWLVLRGIPYGRTISYGEQARRLGDARKCRAVGGANGRNPIAVIVPCHRVVAADGRLTGFAAGLDRKESLLRHEGVPLP